MPLGSFTLVGDANVYGPTPAGRAATGTVRAVANLPVVTGPGDPANVADRATAFDSGGLFTLVLPTGITGLQYTVYVRTDTSGHLPAVTFNAPTAGTTLDYSALVSVVPVAIIATAESTAGAIAKVEAHRVDTTDVHGIADMATLTPAGLSATYARLGRARPGTAAAVVRKLKTGISPVVITALGDSTGDAGDEWIQQLATWLAAQYPTYSLRARTFYDSAQNYGDWTAVQVGTAGEAAFTFANDAAKYLSTVDSAALDIAGDLDIRIKITPTDWTPAAAMTLVSKFGFGGNHSYELALASGGLSFMWSADGTADITKQYVGALPFADGTPGWVRVTHDVDNTAAGNTVAFFSSPDGMVWTQLGADVVTAGVTSHFANTMNFALGARSTGAAQPFTGSIHYAELRNGIGGFKVAAMHADQYPSRSDGKWTDDMGLPWVNNGGVPWVGSRGILFLNGSVGGQAVTYATDVTRQPKLTPCPSDALIVSYGHNSNGTVATFRADYDLLIAAIRTKWPDVGIIASTQNPRIAPAGYINDHAIRNDQIVAYAQSKAYDLIDAYGEFLAQPTLVGLINAGDGVHPLAAGEAVWLTAAKRIFSAWI